MSPPLPDPNENPLQATKNSVDEAEGRLRLRSLHLDPRKLLYFTTLVEHGSFTKAARVLGISQPGLSTSMNRLEAELGLQLVARGSWGVTPTYYGEMLYAHSRMNPDKLEAAERNLPKDFSQTLFPIRFGCLPTLATNVIPTAVAQWRKEHMNRELRIVEAVQFDLLTGLLKREIDVFVGYTEKYKMVEGISQRLLFQDRLSVIARSGHPLFSRDVITLDSLVDFPWVFLPAGPFNLGFQDELEQAGIRLKGANTICNSISLMKTLVRRGNHLALMPAHTIADDMADGRLAVLPFSMPGFARDIAIFMREDSSIEPATLALIDDVQAIGSVLGGMGGN